MSKYVYFVSYAHASGFGNLEITQDMKMKEIKHIRGVEKIIIEEGGAPQPVVINYQLLKVITDET